MGSYKVAFGSFLKTEDLGGKAVRVVIDHAGVEEIKGDAGTERKLVIHFAGKDKAMICNRTNAESIEAIAGTDDMDEWAGLTVVLFPTTTKFSGKTVPCLRVRGPMAKPVPVHVEPEPDEDQLDASEIPF